MSKKTTLLAGVIGDPIAQSKSPILHGHWLKRYNIDGRYDAIHVTRDDLPAALARLQSNGYRGINVTIPHKEAVLSLAHRVTDRAALIGAANTLTFGSDGTIWADNTDGLGFLANIRDYYPDFTASSGPAIVLGAGGAARAVICALLQDGAPEIWLMNRTKQKAVVLRDQFGARVKIHDQTQFTSLLPQAALLVNTTSLGMVSQPPLNLSLDGLPQDCLVTDLVYAPLITPLLVNARERGARVVDGLGMLLHQAAPGFERWFNHRPEVDADLRAAVLAV